MRPDAPPRAERGDPMKLDLEAIERRAAAASEAAAKAGGDVAALVAEVRRLLAEAQRLEREAKEARAEAGKAAARAPAAQAAARPAAEADEEASVLLAAPFHVGPKAMKAAQTDPLVALAVQAARALQPDAKEVERARLIAMSLAATNGDMDAFWAARRQRGGKTSKKK